MPGARQQGDECLDSAHMMTDAQQHLDKELYIKHGFSHILMTIERIEKRTEKVKNNSFPEDCLQTEEQYFVTVYTANHYSILKQLYKIN